MALFTGAFVGIVMFFSEYLIQDVNVIMKALVAGLSALFGGLIGNRLFTNKETQQLGVMTG